MDFKSISFLLFTLCHLRIMCAANSYGDDKLVPPSYTINGGADDTATLSPLLLPPPPPPPLDSRSNKFAPFKPSIAVIVGVLTTMFSITFLLLLYAKHCKRGNGGGISGMYGGNVGVSDGSLSTGRRNSGIDRTVIESLPVFKFGSLRGQKDGLECAVCLTRFDSTEVLRLLPKCKHAFHVECVDTWLDAHSTCPLCRYRVDAEDILLVEDSLLLRESDSPAAPSPLQLKNHVAIAGIESRRSGTESITLTDSSYKRVSGRHSSAGERGNNNAFLQIILQKPGETATENNNSRETTIPATRRSLDSSNTKRKNTESVSLNKCFDHRNRKDGLLLLLSSDQNRKSYDQRRFEHRIILSADHSQQRWSDVQPSDLLYLRSEMILSDSHRYSSGSRPSTRTSEHDHDDGRNVIKTRSVSEITGLSRLASINYENNNHKNSSGNVQKEKLQQRHKGVVSRWMAWISQSQLNVRSTDHVSISRQ